MIKNKENYLAFGMICLIISVAFNLFVETDLFQNIVLGFILGVAMISIILYLLRDQDNANKK